MFFIALLWDVFRELILSNIFVDTNNCQNRNINPFDLLPNNSGKLQFFQLIALSLAELTRLLHFFINVVLLIKRLSTPFVTKKKFISLAKYIKYIKSSY